MSTRTFVFKNLVRFALVCLVFVSFVNLTPSRLASANQSGATVSDFATALVQVCRNMGGHEEVQSEYYPNGKTQILVSCDGGFLDGLICNVFTGTTGMMRSCGIYKREAIETDSNISPIETGAVSPEIATEPEIVEPEPTPVVDPNLDPVVTDPVIDDGNTVPEPTATPVDVTDDPLIDNGAVVDDGNSETGVEPVVPEPQINTEEIAPVEPVILT